MIQQIIAQRRKIPSLILIVVLANFTACKNHKTVRIHRKEFEMEGYFLSDSIPDGLIKFYLPGTEQIIAANEYENGVLNGKSINYYGSRIIQTANYFHGFENGFREEFDSTNGELVHSEFYYYGKRIGPIYDFNKQGDLKYFDFSSFENETLYRVEFDSISNSFISDETEKLVNVHVERLLVDNKDQLRVLFYYISPPKSKVDYKLCYLDINNNVVDSIDISSGKKAFFWEGSIPNPSENQNLAFIVSKYDSVTKKTQTILNYIKER